MELLKRLENYSKDLADATAFINAFTQEAITYSKLWEYSDKIAAKRWCHTTRNQ